MLVVLIVGCNAVRDKYSVAGEYDKHSAQGFAICGDKAFLANNTGICRIYDLKGDSIISSFRFESSHKNNHSNCLDFGVEYPRGNRDFPALYISECSGKGRCFVEDVTIGKSSLIQTITFKERVTDWFIDRENRKIYAMAHFILKEKMTDSVTIYKFALPSIYAGDIDLTDKIEDYFRINLPYVLQGGTIHEGKMYLPVCERDKDKIKKNKLIVVDLKEFHLKKIIDLDEIINESEDLYFYHGRLLLFCGQKGGIFRIM